MKYYPEIEAVKGIIDLKNLISYSRFNLLPAMLPKFCIFASKTNYRSQWDKSASEMNKIFIYHFPKSKKREQCRKSVPSTNLTVRNNTTICQLDWLSNFDTTDSHGEMCPLKSTRCRDWCVKASNSNACCCSKGYKISCNTLSQNDEEINSFLKSFKINSSKLKD